MKNKANIRLYNSSDCNEIIELFYNTVHSINVKDYTDEQLNAWASKEIDSTHWDKTFLEHYSVVAEIDGVIVGFGDIDNEGYFDRLYVHKDYQAKGIATMIADELENHVLKNKTKIITTHSSITAKPFFEQRGYRLVKEQTVERKGQRLVNFVMEKHFAV